MFKSIKGILAVTAIALTYFSIGIALPVDAGVAPRTVRPAETFDVGMLRVERFNHARGRAPLIFIPALYCGSWQWNRETAALAAKHDIYIVTLPGFDGRKPDTGAHLMSRANESLARLIRERHLRHPIVIGHSLGGTLAVLFAETYPEEVGGVITAEGGYPIAPTLAKRRRLAEAASRPYLGVDAATFARRLRANQLQYVITSPQDVETVARYANRSDPTAVALWMRAALEMDLTPHLNRIQNPIVAIVPFSPAIDPYNGFRTLFAKRDAYRAWLKHARKSELIMVDHSRHFVMFDQPAIFDAALYASIDRIERKTWIKRP